MKRSTYYDEKKRLVKTNKYQRVKDMIQNIFLASHKTYGYRRIHQQLLNQGVKISANTVLKLMHTLGIKNHIYRRHTSSYRSYKGNVGTKAPNFLKQTFNATQPYTVIHTDVTQIRLTNRHWAYISAMTDEATKEILALQISAHPDKQLIVKTIDQLKNNLPTGTKPIIHSDQGWHYQQNDYQANLKALHCIPSMSRKGNCLDNAPIESFFNLLKRESLNQKHIKNIEELRIIVDEYVHWFNHERISLKTKGLPPIAYRKQVLGS